MTQIQIDEELFVRLVRYFLCPDDEAHRLDHGEYARTVIKDMLQERFNRYAMRHFYQKYRHAPNDTEREQYLREYLEMKERKQ